ncbi:hypothetical protein [[Flexibacter] sp. ATCC 35208]|uniref:hypothetical protein n=1 Tax=[Flexibacter] sp. ATCC 35208 TaxID=1936242 RepID=UPI0009D38730|nr:hypothetical protein [[Flexibacter] sp. ATCC 35208]OMP74538.1 hypothetical protein BW716_34830 [[Flexibacter] sp. ATCC 35208]
MKAIDLHSLVIPVDGHEPQYLTDNSVTTISPHFDSIEAIFRNHENRLLAIIKSFENGAIFGCVAWLTSTP